MADTRPYSQWLFSPSDLFRTPSNDHGIMFGDEVTERANGIHFLYRIGSTCQMKMNAMAAAAIYFHRFFMRRSFSNYRAVEIAATCVFLATKVEECTRKLKHIVALCVIKNKPSSEGRRDTPDTIDENSPEFIRWHELILTYEDVVLEALCFDLVVDHPHGYLCDSLDQLAAPADVADHAWSIASDSLRTPLCVIYAPHIIACASYLLSRCVLHGWDLVLLGQPSFQSPEDDWEEAFGISPEERASLADAVANIIDFYVKNDIRNPLKDITPPAAGRVLVGFMPSSILSPPSTDANGIYMRSPNSVPPGRQTPSAQDRESSVDMQIED